MPNGLRPVLVMAGRIDSRPSWGSRFASRRSFRTRAVALGKRAGRSRGPRVRGL